MLKRFAPALFLVSQLLLVTPAVAQKKPAKPPKQRDLKPGWPMFLKPEQDVEMGQEALNEIESQITLTNDPTLTKYINDIGNRLVAQIPNPTFKFQFRVVNDPEINAFAVPGGFIYINSGIVKNADNEGQVAAVMGHEIGHVMLRHSANQMSKAMLAQGLLMGAQVAGQMKGGWAAMAGQLGAPLGAQLMMMKFSRNHEKDADAYGARLMAAAGWNPIESARFFEKLEALTKGKNAGGVAGWMSSHPPPDNRAKLLEEEILAFPGRKEFSYATGDWQRALQASNALVPAPKKAPAAQQQQAPATPSQTVQGFSVYRARSFEVSYPAQWRVAANPESDGALIAPQEGVTQNGVGFGVAISVEPYKTQQPTLESETQALIAGLQKQQQMQVVQQPAKRQIDGQPAYLTMMSSQSPLQGGGRELDMLVTVMRPSGLWNAVLICPESAWGQQQQTFEKIVGSIRFAR